MKIKNAKPTAEGKAALAVAQTGTDVPERDFSSKATQAKAAGPQTDTAPWPGKGPSTPPTSSGRMSHGYGHPAPARDGCLRTSGHSGAHRIGKKK